MLTREDSGHVKVIASPIQCGRPGAPVRIELGGRDGWQMSIAITTIRTPAGVFFTGEVTIGQEKLVIGGGSASGVSGIACPWRRSNGTWLCCCSI